MWKLMPWVLVVLVIVPQAEAADPGPWRDRYGSTPWPTSTPTPRPARTLSDGLKSRLQRRSTNPFDLVSPSPRSPEALRAEAEARKPKRGITASLFSSTTTPDKGYRCLRVKSGAQMIVASEADKYATGRIDVYTYRSGRRIELKDYDAIASSNTCLCGAFEDRCTDR